MISRRDFNPFLSTCAAGKSLILPMDQVFNIGIIRSSDKRAHPTTEDDGHIIRSIRFSLDSKFLLQGI